MLRRIVKESGCSPLVLRLRYPRYYVKDSTLNPCYRPLTDRMVHRIRGLGYWGCISTVSAFPRRDESRFGDCQGSV